MSYEPEIFISPERAVLEEIRNPFTRMVSWSVQDGSFDYPLRLVDQFCEKVALHPDAVYDYDNRVDNVSNPIVKWANQGYLEHCDSLLLPCGFKRAERSESGFSSMYQQPGTIPKTTVIPHKDIVGLVRVFLSVNAHMGGLCAVPSPYEGEETHAYAHYYENADMSKALQASGVSLTMADLDRLAHFAPKNPPTHAGRFYFELDYIKPR